MPPIDDHFAPGGPRFDSAACFAALLPKGEQGRWQISQGLREARRRFRAYSPSSSPLTPAE